MSPPKNFLEGAPAKPADLRSLLDDENVRELTRLAAMLCEASSAAISLIEGDSFRYSASSGFPATQLPRSGAFCEHTLQGSTTLVIPDATVDPRFANSPLVSGEARVKFYAGTPLLADGQTIVGVLCVVDREARCLKPEQIEGLESIGRQVINHLRLQWKIADAQRVESQLRDASDQLRAIAANVPGAIIRHAVQADGTDALLYVSDQSTHLWELSPAETMAQTRSISSMILAEDLPAVRQSIAVSARDLSPWICTWRIRTPSGKLKCLQGRGHPSRLPDGGTTWDTVILDITQQQQAEDALQQGYDLLRKISRQVPGVIYQFLLRPDGSTCFPYASEGLRDIYALEPEQVRHDASAVFGRLHPEDAAAVRTSIEKSATTLKPWSHEYRVVLPAKGVRWARGDSRPEPLPDGSILWHGYISDITDQKRAEEHYLRAQRLNSIGTLAGGIAHDLNNVLAPILMGVEMLRLKSTEPDDNNLLRTIEASARRGADLVSQVLAFARGAEGQKIRLRPGQILRDLDKILRETFPKSIRLQIDFGDHVWPIRGDRTQIQQILLNLCVNARDAMPEGGVLGVSVANVESDGLGAGHFVAFSVSDTGSGIPSDLRDRIFEPFFTTKDVGKGTGLGLSTALSLVQGHKGSIALESEVGKGSTFKVYLPAEVADVPLHVPPIPDSQLPRGAGEWVLVVDDEESVRHVTQRTLERYGYRVRTAENGRQALTVYAEAGSTIAVVLTDIAMPVMDGHALILELGRLNRSVKLVAMSGLDAGGEISRLIAAGTCEYLPKPFSSHALLTTLARTLHR